MRRFAIVVLCLLVSGCGRSRRDAPRAPDTPPKTAGQLLTGPAALGDWTTDGPGVRRKITIADLPAPNASESVDHAPKVVARPESMWPRAPSGFVVTEYATELDAPRVITVAPNGDAFVVESKRGRVSVLRDADGDGKQELSKVFADDLTKPFGLAFYPPGAQPTHVYIANTDSVVRFPYAAGDLAARRPKETIVKNIPGGGKLRGGGHWTRDLAFSNDGKRMFVSVGSFSNLNDDENEQRRACILAFDPNGGNEIIYASGLRNPVGLAVHPATSELWASVNERDDLGDDLVPDYVTHVTEGGNYGWPWFYLGNHRDPHHGGKRADLEGKITVPDVLLQSHTAALDLAFYTGNKFPEEYHGDLFIAAHGSWNRARRTGYKIIRVRMKDGHAVGEYEDFVTGFVINEEEVWGRPVGVAVANDGALLFTDDGNNRVWRVAFTGK